MNDHISVESFIEIELLQDTAYHIDQPLDGNLNIWAKKNINDVGKVQLILQGFETAQVFKGGKVIDLRKEIINFRFDIYDYTEFHNVISPGAFRFPFTIWLPHLLPQSSILMQDDSIYKKKKPVYYERVNRGRIEYKLVAEILGVKTQVPIDEFSFTKTFVVLPPLQDCHLNFHKLNTTLNLTSTGFMCCCLSKGVCHIKVILEKEKVYSREIIKMFVEVDNKHS